MLRFEALSRVVWEHVPTWAVDAFGAVTVLGGATFLLFALSLLYWLVDRRTAATVVAYAFVALGVVVALKWLLALSRPPATARPLPYDGDPYGFPSGHAVAAVVVYGGLASVRDRLGDRRVAGGVVLVVGVVAVSRVALAVHYVGDVLAGVAVGCVLLVACRRFVGSDPHRGFALAVVAAVAGVLAAGPAREALLALGGSLGGLAGSRRLDVVPDVRSHVEGAVLAGVGVPSVYLADELAAGLVAPPLVVLAYAGVVAGVLLLPAVVGRLPDRAVRA